MSVTLHTDLGDIKIELFCEQCPMSTENFLALCGTDYYNNCVFHRNIKGFMFQTGDPLGTGKGGTSIWGRKFEDELRDGLKHNVRGVVSMANNGPDTNGSQFFITYGKQPHLDMKYTVIGKVIDGFETLDEFEKLPVNEKHKPETELLMRSTTSVYQVKCFACVTCHNQLVPGDIYSSVNGSLICEQDYQKVLKDQAHTALASMTNQKIQFHTMV